MSCMHMLNAGHAESGERKEDINFCLKEHIVPQMCILNIYY